MAKMINFWLKARKYTKFKIILSLFGKKVLGREKILGQTKLVVCDDVDRVDLSRK